MTLAFVLLTAQLGAAPYSVPWQLRPTGAATVVRSDTAFAFFEGEHRGSTIASMLLGSFRVAPGFAPFVRLGFVDHAAGASPEMRSLVNPVVGANYAFQPSEDLRLAFYLGATIPIGMHSDANKMGALARSAMDNAMFAVDDFALLPGVDFAWVDDGATVQIEATLMQLFRVRGEGPDAARTNLTLGLHVGYFLAPQVSVGAELRYQRFLSTPAAVAKDPPTRDVLSFAAGPRLHLQLAETIWIRPGLSYGRGLDDPMSNRDYGIVQLDVPVSF
jgi:hypothetical protein